MTFSRKDTRIPSRGNRNDIFARNDKAVFINRRERYETRKILAATGQDEPRTIVEGELTSRRVFCSGRPQADWELRKPNVRSSRFALCCLPALESNSVEATIPGK